MIRTRWLTNSAYGFPRGAKRRISPKVLAVVHITANMGDADAQRDYANRDGSNGPSAHYYIDRDGGGVHAIDERTYAAWSNGDLKSPRLTNAGVRYLDALRPVHNANEGCYLEIECVGTATTAGQWTEAQFDTVARLIADAADDTGLTISATTVLPHAYINTIDRAHCPSLNVGAHMSKLIALAKVKQAEKAVPTMTTFTWDAKTFRKGTIRINGTTHWYLRLVDSTLHGPIDPTNAQWVDRPAFGPVKLVPPIPGGTVGSDRATAYIVPEPNRSTEAAAILASAVTFTPDSADCADDIAAAITADRAKAHIVYGP